MCWGAVGRWGREKGGRGRSDAGAASIPCPPPSPAAASAGVRGDVSGGGIAENPAGAATGREARSRVWRGGARGGDAVGVARRRAATVPRSPARVDHPPRVDPPTPPGAASRRKRPRGRPGLVPWLRRRGRRRRGPALASSPSLRLFAARGGVPAPAVGPRHARGVRPLTRASPGRSGRWEADAGDGPFAAAALVRACPEKPGPDSPSASPPAQRWGGVAGGLSPPTGLPACILPDAAVIVVARGLGGLLSLPPPSLADPAGPVDRAGTHARGEKWSSRSPPPPRGQPASSEPRPQIRRGDPLNLSILVSGGKETNQDSLSNGE